MGCPLDHALPQLCGALDAAGRHGQPGPGDQRRQVAGVESAHFLQVCGGRAQPTATAFEVRQQGQHVRAVAGGCGLQAPAKDPVRSGHIAAQLVGIGVPSGHPDPRLASVRHPQRGELVAVPPELGEGVHAQSQRCRVVGVDRQRPVGVGERLVELVLHPVQGAGGRVRRHVVVGLDLQRAGHRLLGEVVQLDLPADPDLFDVGQGEGGPADVVVGDPAQGLLEVAMTAVRSRPSPGLIRTSATGRRGRLGFGAGGYADPAGDGEAEGDEQDEDVLTHGDP